LDEQYYIPFVFPSASRARNAQAGTFHFFNVDYNPRANIQAKYGVGPVQRRVPDANRVGGGVGFEDSHTFRYRFGVKRIVVKLVACESPRAPGLGHLEIWGQPANHCDDEAVGAIIDGELNPQTTDVKMVVFQVSASCVTNLKPRITFQK
jgi:hypothetical protein